MLARSNIDVIEHYVDDKYKVKREALCESIDLIKLAKELEEELSGILSRY